MGKSSDPYMMTYSRDAHAGEVLLLRGSTTLNGRYVSLYRKDISMCLCFLQVFRA